MLLLYICVEGALVKNLTKDVRALNKEYHEGFEKREAESKKQFDIAMAKIKELEPKVFVHETQNFAATHQVNTEHAVDITREVI
ncbi:hypothetical protein L2E82_22929 [Cichorium intybus]|uniref:Uncharacterized protein n=1 Tax=Cichorium intybus TaxID=13427 RepID=A0ACB9DYQ4_CICIN|nr:hypothetical protein L2E82_22929 [Cichorium intybus]